MSKLNRMLNKVFSLMRINKIMIIIILGSVRMLEKQPLQKGLIRCLINVYGRDIKKSHCNIRVYDAANIFYLMWLMERNEKTGKAPLSAYGKTYLYARSKILKADEKDEKLWDDIDFKQKGAIQDGAALESKGLVDSKYIAKETGYSLIYIRRLLVELNPEVHRVGSKKFYFKSVIKLIEDMPKSNKKGYSSPEVED